MTRIPIPDVEAWVVSSYEGLTVFSAPPQGPYEDIVAAISASLYAISEKCLTELGLGEFDQAYIKGSEGYILSLQAGPNYILTASISIEARLGLIFMDIIRLRNKIAENQNFDWMGDDSYPYPDVFKPPSPPGDLGRSGQAQLKLPTFEENLWDKPYCKNCGSILSEGQSICHVCKKKVL